MKRILLLALVCFSLTAFSGRVCAQTRIVENSISRPVKGAGGWSEVKYTFEKGEKVSIQYHAAKLLDRVIVTMGTRDLLARKTATKNGNLEFTIPYTGEVTVRFISDRNGQNPVKYEVVTNGSAEGTPITIQ